MKELAIHYGLTLIVNQVQGDYATHNSTMRLCLVKAKTILEEFEKYEIQLIFQNENSYTDVLVNIESTVDYSLQQIIPFEYLIASRIRKLEPEMVAISNTRENWIH